MAILLAVFFVFFSCIAGAQQSPGFAQPYSTPYVQPLYPQQAQPARQPEDLLGILAKPWFMTTKFLVKQDALSDISLSENLNFPREYTAYTLGIFAGRRPVRILYEFTPAIRSSGNNRLPGTLTIGGTIFGATQTSATGQQTQADPIFMEAQVTKHRIEFAAIYDVAPNTLVIPRIGTNFYPIKIAAHTADNKLADSWGSTVSVFTLGAAFEERYQFLVVTLAGDYLVAKNASGFTLDGALTLIPVSRQYPIFLSAGYLIEQMSVRFAGGSVESDARGPYLRAELRF